MGKLPTEIEEIFESIPGGSRIPNDSDLCDMLLYYTIMVELGFPEADGKLTHHIVTMFQKAHIQWSTLFQYFGTKSFDYVKLELDITVFTGTNHMRETATRIFYDLGWIKGLDTSDKDSILLEVFEPLEDLTDSMIHTFLLNRQMLSDDWGRFFAEDFSLYKPVRFGE
jgi:hypothetical protein